MMNDNQRCAVCGLYKQVPFGAGDCFQEDLCAGHVAEEQNHSCNPRSLCIDSEWCEDGRPCKYENTKDATAATAASDQPGAGTFNTPVSSVFEANQRLGLRIAELEREREELLADRDMWIKDSTKQNDALGRVIVERDALREENAQLKANAATNNNRPVAWRYRYSNLGSWRYVEREELMNPSDEYTKEALYSVRYRNKSSDEWNKF
jgi:hypothetical protein